MIDHTQDADRSEVASVFDEHRGLLVSVAYRVLGSVTDAEDAVQEAWIRWSGADHSSGGDPREAGRRPGSRLDEEITWP
jgi:RNA polymerase sigma-70 factor (ECF subfamily)